MPRLFRPRHLLTTCAPQILDVLHPGRPNVPKVRKTRALRLLPQPRCAAAPAHALCRPRSPSTALQSELTEKLAKMFDVKDAATIFLHGFRTQFGGGKSTGFGLIYDNMDIAKKLVSKHLLVRVSSRCRPRRSSAAAAPDAQPPRPVWRHRPRHQVSQADQGAQEPLDEGSRREEGAPRPATPRRRIRPERVRVWLRLLRAGRTASRLSTLHWLPLCRGCVGETETRAALRGGRIARRPSLALRRALSSLTPPLL